MAAFDANPVPERGEGDSISSRQTAKCVRDTDADADACPSYNLINQSNKGEVQPPESRGLLRP
ncbi:hypothetical protein GCM10010917_24510 [Paenibacillus physcomitrellae]|uniref:Uncharacterized protein n=1 Tax=Paenibacillus physcomitrellae TaxID=1619311 RepID=A0ABQ1G7N1_9BACL|nr:hypothetical protein GCM10010917_24510 [Paenibacillus physcomitrellae]